MSDRPAGTIEDASFNGFIKRLANGDERAADELFALYSKRLVALARTRTSRRLQQKLDAEDVLQSVFRSFFVRQRKGLFELTDWDGLWGLLVRITLRKCNRNLERFQAARRDVRRESSPSAEDDTSFLSWKALAREPTPEEAIQLSETIEHLIRDIDDDKTRKILEMRLYGFTVREISVEIGCTERTAHRKLDRIRTRLKELLATSEKPQ